MVKRKQPENDAAIFSMGMGSQMGIGSQMGMIQKVVAQTVEIKDYFSEKGISPFMKNEITIMDLPICCLNDNIDNGIIREIYFSKEKDKYIRIIPSADPRSISNKVPQAFDGKILDAIFKLATDNNNQTIITDFPALEELAGIPSNNRERVRDSLERWRNCRYEFYNTFYKGSDGNVYRGNLSLNFLSLLFIGSKEELQTATLTQDEKDSCWARFSGNKKISLVVVLKLDDDIYKNLHHKSGWLAVNYNILRSFKDKNEMVARFLYKILLKWGGNEKRKNPKWNNKLLVNCCNIAASLGLDLKSANIGKTLSSIKTAAGIVKEKGVLIENFKILPTKPKQPLSESVIEFSFKPGVFDKNKAIERQQTTLDEYLTDSQTKQPGKNNRAAGGGFSADVENLFQKIPEKERSENPEKEVKNEINEALQNGKDADYIILCIYYAVLRQKKGFFKAFKKAIKDNLVEKEKINPEKLNAEFQELKEKRKQEANKPKTEKEIEKAYNEAYKAAATEKYQNMSDAEKAALHVELENSGKKPCDFDKYSILRIAKDLEKDFENEFFKSYACPSDAPEYKKISIKAYNAGYSPAIDRKYFI